MVVPHAHQLQIAQCFSSMFWCVVSYVGPKQVYPTIRIPRVRTNSSIIIPTPFSAFLVLAQLRREQSMIALVLKDIWRVYLPLQPELASIVLAQER